MLGAAFTLVLLALMVLPLAIVFGGGGLGDTNTIRIYTVALVLDFVVLVAGISASVYAAVRASRGEIVTLPLVTSLSERLFRPRRR